MAKPLEVHLETLCEIFQDELDRQEDLLALCKLQGRAALEHDVELLEARTEAINALVAQAAGSEQQRLDLANALVTALGLPQEKHTLSGLIEVAPDPWRRRMAEFQARMRAVLAETREVVRQNNLVMRRSAKIVADALGVLTQCTPAAGHYDARGGETTTPAQAPACLDQRG